MGGSRIALVLALMCATVPGRLAGETPIRKHGNEVVRSRAARLLQPEDGLAIIAAALKIRSDLNSGYDCSHMVQAVYEQAGFSYKYATSGQLYAGVTEFRRVWHPQPGDLVTFPGQGGHGHVGIMVDPAQRLFFSHLSHGPSVSSYASPYWRRRGVPHFFRYVRKLPSRSHAVSSPSTTGR
jgi:cell wall-associated NlpC family hydrolase